MKKPDASIVNAQIIYVAVHHDRHSDDEILSYTNVNDAIKKCKEWISKYPKDRYHFVEKGFDHIFYADAGEDYSVRVDAIVHNS